MKVNTSRLLGRAFFAAGLLLAASAGTSWATFVEGFESSSLTASNSIGDASIQGVYFTINPDQLTKQLLLTTINNTAGSDFPIGGGVPSNQSGNNAVANTTSSGGLANFFGITSAGIIRNGTTAVGQEGSGFLVNLGALNAGDVVSFRYDFLTQDNSGQPDFGFVTLNNGTSTSYKGVFAQASNATTATTGAGNPFNLETGYQTFSLTITTAGTYTLGIGIADATDKTIASGVLIDNILTVPEPSTLGLGMAGAVLLVALRRVIKKTS